MTEYSIELQNGWLALYTPTPQVRPGTDSAWTPLPHYTALASGAWLRRIVSLEPVGECVNYVLRIIAPAGSLIVEVNGEEIFQGVSQGAPLEFDVTYHVSLGDNTLTLWLDGAPQQISLCAVPCQ